MRSSDLQGMKFQGKSFRRCGCIFLFQIALMTTAGAAQTSSQDVAEQIQKLREALVHTQAQLEQSQHEMDEIRRQLAALQQVADAPDLPQESAAEQLAAAAQSGMPADELRERLAMQETQIATQEQTKVETESKFPLKLSGLLLFNGFVNTRQVDMASAPTIALAGSGSTGASVRQTVLGFDARGPHLLGASSRADLRVDFFGSPAYSAPGAVNGTDYPSAYSASSSLLRLRTAHATLDWKRTQAFFSLDRTILNPDSPSSLTALAEPALAWSGNLWAWNPQIGVRHDVAFGETKQLRLEAAVIDVADAPVSYGSAAASQMPGVPFPSAAEQSRWPGTEARIALMGATSSSKPDAAAHLGLGGYFAPHRTPDGYRFDAWASTIDYRVPLPLRLSLSGDVYRGQALGGLGGGGYKDYVAYISPPYFFYRVPDDIGGWSQLKETVSERLEFNAAFGLDELSAGQLRPYAGTPGAAYLNLARNRTFTGNVIYSPSAYLLFSLEYRHLESSPVTGANATSNIIGLGAGYKF